MAKSYNDIYTAVYTKGNKMDFTNSMIRGNGIPLDITDVYNSFEAAQNYVNSNPVAYEGQVIAVTENNDTTVYVIAARLTEDGVTVEHYLKEVGKTPEVDNVTIKVVDGKLTAVIPEYEDTDTQYTLSVLADGKISFISDATGAEATEISFVGAQGIEVTSNAETGIITITGPDLSGYATKTELADKANAADVYSIEEINDLIDGIEENINAKANSADVYTKSEIDQITSEQANRFDELEDKASQKADRVDVYSKTETDKKIGEAVAAADHLKRKIVDTKEEINIDAIDAMQYIYMVPSGLTANDNKYYEYIVLEENGLRYVEQVGNWEVDLSAYLTEADAENTYATITNLNSVTQEFAARSDELEDKVSNKVDRADVYITTEADQKFATKADLENYDTAEEIAEIYATIEGVEETLKDYSTSEKIAEEYVSNDELTTALEPYAKTADIPTDYVSDSEFEEAMKAYDTAEVSKEKYADKGETELALSNKYTKEETNNLLGNKVDTSVATAEDGLRFINQVEINKLSKLNLEGDDITISGSVNASQVKELYATVANIVKGSTADLDPDTEGSQLGLGIQEGAQVNFINNINTDIFSVDSDKKLDLVKVPVGKLDGLETWIEENRDIVTGLYPTAAATLLSGLDTAINNEETGLIAGLTAVKARVLTNEDAIKDHADRLDALEYAMTWRDMEENI